MGWRKCILPDSKIMDETIALTWSSIGLGIDNQTEERIF